MAKDEAKKFLNGGDPEGSYEHALLLVELDARARQALEDMRAEEAARPKPPMFSMRPTASDAKPS